jgi:hypothetical protein
MSMYPPFTAEHAGARTRQLRRDAEDARAVALARVGQRTDGAGRRDARLRLVTFVDAPQPADSHRPRGVAARVLDRRARTTGRFGLESRARGGGVPCTSSEPR